MIAILADRWQMPQTAAGLWWARRDPDRLLKTLTTTRTFSSMGGELVFAGTRVEVKALVDYLKGGHTLDDFLEGFATVSREQAEAYLETTLRAAEAAPRRPTVGVIR